MEKGEYLPGREKYQLYFNATFREVYKAATYRL